LAGDWIKMRVGLTTNPHVLRIAERLLDSADYLEWAGLAWGVGGYPPLSQAEADAEKHVALRITRYVTVTALLKFWGYANEHAKGDFIDGIRTQDVLEITGVPGFSAALEAAGWAEFDAKNGGVRMPNFDEHNTGARERSSAGAERQKRYRERKKAEANSHVTRDVTVTEREEKRREDIKEPKKRATQLPEGFTPNNKGIDMARAAGLNVDREVSKFCDHHAAKGSKFMNWQAAWRTWVGNAVDFGRGKTQDADPYGLKTAVNA
jgi:hypothetical protein